MQRLWLVVSWMVLIGFSAVALSCGASPHQLKSITLNPTNADAKNFSGGQVQFTATGHYDTDPITVTPIAATWGVCSNFQSTHEVSVTSSGLARCAIGASGTYTIWANNPAVLPPGAYTCVAQTACGGGCVIQGEAQLTCP